ncbi:hypothetical protein [Caballeronia sp. S22]|uniref:hypothetical protein n=1 Tax=Caballeronia sp. S22 TaxID=3137182 RepID=UPI003530D429
MNQFRGKYAERREPTMGAAREATMPRNTGRSISRAEVAYERRQEANLEHRRDSFTDQFKAALWVLVWLGMVWGCQQAASTLQPRSPDGFMYFFAALGTAWMLLITFWRTGWRLVWWFIGLVIVLAVIKGAVLIVFTL